jgi:hypothetical protein
MIQLIIITAAASLLSFNAYSVETNPPAAASSDKTGLSGSFRCEKFNGSLSDLKLKLIEICNLDKPFTSSMTRLLGSEEVYVFCCHKAK